MKLGPIAQDPFEWLALKTNLAPVPLVHTQLFFVFSKAILSAFSLDVFESLKHKPQNVKDASAITGLDERALKSLFNILVAGGYLRYYNGKYSLTALSRKWCLRESSSSLYSQQLFNTLCWRWMDHMETFLRTGEGIRFHSSFTEEEWKLYMEGMECFARTFSKPAVSMAPALPNVPKRMLDIGGGHGIYSAAFCNAYPTLQATVFDLPEAIASGSVVLKKYYKGERVHYQAGDATVDCFGNSGYDLVLLSNIIHHFTYEQAVDVLKRAQQALKSNGYLLIHECLRSESQGRMDAMGAILNLFFDLTSSSGCWTAKEIRQMINEAGLRYRKANSFTGMRGYFQIVAS
jgi:ubiquinone/menaquinone biosynthesis C-methylase UbiE